MPELPEVEVVKLGLEPLLVGRVLQKCGFSGKALRLPIPRSQFKNWVLAAKVIGLRRRAKFISIDLDNKANIVVHLGMTGKLGLFTRKSVRKPHDHAWILLDNEMELRFNDVRRFGSLQVVSPEEDGDALFAKIGPEPFSEEFSVDYLTGKAKKRGQPVKNFLMDSHIVAGIGNIYASEILFEAGVRPDKAVGRVTAAQWQKIIRKSRSVLKRAIAAGGSTIADFVGSSGEKGYFQLQLNVYGKKGQSCPLCAASISKTVMAGRATYFCPGCQAEDR
nr:bifunctional DNA-formamidopyrimidine glycosylase/DNA-(apurinic or apyrimidinic site) lyase [Desulfobulbaceae bacterium]